MFGQSLKAMKHRPFAVIHAAASAANDLLIASNTVVTFTCLRSAYAAAIATINADPVTAGLPAGTVIKALPSVPTGMKGLFYQPASAPESAISEVLVDAHVSNGYNDPDSTFDQMLSAAIFAALNTAL